jgi:hypothetical protein
MRVELVLGPVTSGAPGVEVGGTVGGAGGDGAGASRSSAGGLFAVSFARGATAAGVLQEAAARAAARVWRRSRSCSAQQRRVGGCGGTTSGRQGEAGANTVSRNELRG